MEAYLPLSGLADVANERLRLEKRSAKLVKEFGKLGEGRLGSWGFVDNTPKAVVDKARAELAELKAREYFMTSK